MPKPFYYGGQAVLDGVMMRGRKSLAVACRAPDGRVLIYEEELKPGPVLRRVRNLPFIRGAVVLWDTLILGTRSLIFSANVSLQGIEAEEGEEEEPATMSGPILWITMAFSLLFAIGLFFMVPVVLTWFLERFIDSHALINVIEGLVRVGLLLGYLWFIGRMADIRRVFAYHGAEHKTINAWEKNLPLDVEHVRKQPLEHVRCGTGFLLIVAMIAVFVFILLGRPSFVWLVVSRIVLVPVIAAIAYEVIRLGAARASNPLVHAMLWPGLKLQRMTTREPDDDMLDVAIMSFKRVAVADGVLPEQALHDGAIRVNQLGEPLAAPVELSPAAAD
jgi:uncharacterized protein YqhQ